MASLISSSSFDTVFNLSHREANSDGPNDTQVRAKITLSGEVVYSSGRHNHMPSWNGHAVEVRAARNAWLTAIREYPRTLPTTAIPDSHRE